MLAVLILFGFWAPATELQQPAWKKITEPWSLSLVEAVVGYPVHSAYFFKHKGSLETEKFVVLKAPTSWKAHRDKKNLLKRFLRQRGLLKGNHLLQMQALERKVGGSQYYVYRVQVQLGEQNQVISAHFFERQGKTYVAVQWMDPMDYQRYYKKTDQLIRRLASDH